MNVSTVAGRSFRHISILSYSSFEYLLAGVVVLSSIFGVLLFDSLQTWAIIPHVLCGIIVCFAPIGGPAFSPPFVLRPLFLHFFYIAPMLQLAWERSVAYVAVPSAWEPWIGALGALNILSLIGLGAGVALTRNGAGVGSTWVLNEGRFHRVVLPLLVVTAVVQVLVYLRFGGISGYIAAYESKSGAFAGMGWVFMIAESFPILLFMWYAVLARRIHALRRRYVVMLALLGFFVVSLIFGGLRGSRANTVWSVFWAAGIAHLYIRRLPRMAFPLGLAFVIFFALVYGFYKSSGQEAIARTISGEGREVAEETGRGLDHVLLGDFARVGVQSLIVYRLTDGATGEYELAKGRSYIGALALMIPKQVWPNRPETKTLYGTQLLHGNRDAEMGFRSSRQYGLGGEAMLNFSIAGLPIAYLLYGLLLGWSTRKVYSLSSRDCRWLLVPVLAILFCLAVTSDSDNLVFFFVKNVALPGVVIASCARREVRHA